MRKQVSEVQMKIRHEIICKMRGFIEYFQQPKSKKLRYLEELGVYHFHKYAIRNTLGLNEYEFRKWIKEDDAFRECVNALRQQFIDECEYLMLCRAGYYGADKQKRFAHVDNRSMAEFVKIARGYGVYRKYSGDGWGSKTKPAEGVSAGGEGKGGSVDSAGSEGSVCSVSEADSVS